MGGIKEGFAEPVTCEMEFDGGVEAHQGGKKEHEQCSEMGKCSHASKELWIQIPHAGLGSRPCSELTPILRACAWYVEQGELAIY